MSKLIESFEEYKSNKDESVTEARHIDIQWCLKTIKEWNKESDTNSYEDLSKDIIKHLGFKVNDKNIEIAADHLAACEQDNGDLPVDADIIKELVPMLESVNENWSDKLKKLYGDDYQGFMDIQWNKNTPAARKTKKKYDNDREVIANALKTFQATAERFRNENVEVTNTSGVSEAYSKDKTPKFSVKDFVETFKLNVKKKYISEYMLENKKRLIDAISEMGDMMYGIGDIEKTHKKEFKEILAALKKEYNVTESVIEPLEDYLNESYDIVDDINAYRNRFKKKIEKEDEEDLSKLEKSKGKLKMFLVYQADDYGRSEDDIGVYMAMNDKHACLRAAMDENNMEIFTTGFYKAKEITKSWLSAKVRELENNLHVYKNIRESLQAEEPKESIVESLDDYISEAKKIKENEDGGLSRAGHYALGLKQVRIVISGDSVEKNYKKILKDIEKHDKESNCDFYEKTGKIVGTYAKAKMDNLKRDLKSIDPDIKVEIKDQKLR